MEESQQDFDALVADYNLFVEHDSGGGLVNQNDSRLQSFLTTRGVPTRSRQAENSKQTPNSRTPRVANNRNLNKETDHSDRNDLLENDSRAGE